VNRAARDDFDFSTPEGEKALSRALDLVQEVRNEAFRKTRLYERTLGLAVIPVLLRRAWIRARRRSGAVVK
jgi:Txe/YoeB family toxin of Txe-Axe toxin-antitoxin module